MVLPRVPSVSPWDWCGTSVGRRGHQPGELGVIRAEACCPVCVSTPVCPQEEGEVTSHDLPCEISEHGWVTLAISHCICPCRSWQGGLGLASRCRVSLLYTRLAHATVSQWTVGRTGQGHSKCSPPCCASMSGCDSARASSCQLWAGGCGPHRPLCSPSPRHFLHCQSSFVPSQRSWMARVGTVSLPLWSDRC